ncbi:MAG TPA: FlgD immunoglobulin-like domain containing protein [Candidatus Eisenbacteria bacterium]
MLRIRISWLLSPAVLVLIGTQVAARPADPGLEIRPEQANLASDGFSAPLSGLSSHIYTDTVSYGGTYWAPDSLRWEAIRDSHWSFDSGVGSSINGGSNPNKPVGYHQSMEGWFGLDQTLSPLPYFRRSSTCAIAGSFSFWAGVTLAEANALCYAGGQGYGNNWNLIIEKTFAYPGVGTVSFSFQYAVESEAGFDYAYALIDTSGDGSTDDIVLWTKDGVASGTANVALNAGQDMRSTAGNYTIRFVAASDGSYSDEDGLNPSTCGHLAIDNVTVGADVSNFETGANGWTQTISSTGVGDFSHIADLADLEPPAVFCPCAVRDSVLVFFDTNDQHPLDQDNLAVSPWIDLLANGDAGRSGKLYARDVVAVMPLENYVFLQHLVRYYPAVCSATGLVYRTPFLNLVSVEYFGPTPICNSVLAPSLRDASATIPPAAEQVQLAVGIINLCRTSPFGPPCTGFNNQTPYLDNLSLGVYGSTTTPVVNTTTFDRFQDNFATDGTLNPASTGRFDQNRIKGGSTPSSGSILGDTLNARGNGGNTEVRLVFRVRSGPFINAGILASYVARWTPEPTLNTRYGGTWYSARMDTAEQAGTPAVSPFAWMGTFHEADPGFSGTDRTVDPNDPNRLANDIIPDHLFTPGSRIDYFVASRYRPPDPRNPGGTAWATDPDTLNATFREAEILPSSMAADSSWNCVLYVDHHDDRSGFDQALEETGLRLSLGGGGANAEGTRHDRFDVQTPSSAQMSFGRPLFSRYGVSLLQLFGFKTVVWHSATLTSGQLTNEDAYILMPWLQLRAIGNNNFWGSGEGLMQSMHNTGSGARFMLNNVLGVVQNCTGIRLANCGGTGIDTTYCIPTSAVAGSHFTSTILPRGRGNGCPDLLSFDRLDVNPSVASAKGQLNYRRLVPGQGGALTDIGFASVTNLNTIDVSYRTALDGISVGRMRSNAGYFGVGCDDVTASYERTDDVLDWLGGPLNCRVPQALVDVPELLDLPAPAFRHALGNAYPNPMNPTTRIQFTNGTANGRVKVEIFDVTGRLVRSLVDAKMPAGVHEVTWDGGNEAGSSVPSGMYFYRMSAEDFVAAKKLLVSK